MTFAQMLMVPLAALMAYDIALTKRGLELGFEERNALALRVMQRLGNMTGMLAYVGALLGVVLVVVTLFPSQWALPLAIVVEEVLTVVSNRSWLKGAQQGA